MDLLDLTKFLAKSNLEGYAAQGGQAEADGSKTINYEQGEWRFSDNYFGGEPYGGREVIFYENKPVFIMVYYGRVTDSTLDKEFVYGFLRKALKLFPENYPFRGPKVFEETIDGQNLKYENNWQGEIDEFSGEEKIFIDGREIFYTKYSGGLIDQ